MSRFAAPSPPMIPAAHHGGSQVPKRIVMHSMVMKCFPGAAKACGNFFAHEGNENPTSAHYGIDPVYTFQYVSDHVVAYHCGYNQDSIGIEMADMAGTDITRWSDEPHKIMLHRTAKLVAQLCLAYNIRPYYVGWIGLKVGVKGVTTHAAMTKAFRMSTHTDPGAWPRRRFMRLVRHYVAVLKETS